MPAACSASTMIRNSVTSPPGVAAYPGCGAKYDAVEYPQWLRIPRSRTLCSVRNACTGSSSTAVTPSETR